MRFTSVLTFLFLFSVSMTSMASMAPRMYSVILQGSGSMDLRSVNLSDDVNVSRGSTEMIYLIRNGPSFGFRYFMESRNELQPETGDGYGPLAGYYHDNGIFFLIQYDILAKLGTWRNGEGPQVDLGFVEHIGKQYHLGLKYSYRSIRYKTNLLDNTAVKRENEDTFFSAVLMYLF